MFFFFVVKIAINVQFLVGTSSEVKPNQMVLRLQLLNQLSFVKRHTEIFSKKFDLNLCVQCSILMNDDELRLINSPGLSYPQLQYFRKYALYKHAYVMAHQ